MSEDSNLNLEDDPVIKSIDYVGKMGGFNSIFLKARRLNQQQLQQVAPVIKQILQDYRDKKSFEEMPEEIKKQYRSKESFLETRHEVEMTNLSLLNDFLFNVAKVVGPEKLLEELRKGSKEPSKEEMNYAYAILRLGEYQSKSKPTDSLTTRDIELISSAVDTAYRFVE